MGWREYNLPIFHTYSPYKTGSLELSVLIYFISSNPLDSIFLVDDSGCGIDKQILILLIS
jgi:hypothetical protein